MSKPSIQQLDLAEVNARFFELVDAAARGDGTIIAKSGTPVAMLVPLDRAKRPTDQVRHAERQNPDRR